MTDTSFTPAQNPDLSTLDTATIGFDPTINAQSIIADSQPVSLNYTTGTLSISKPVVLENATIGDVDLISPLPNPNLGNQLVVPSLQVGGTMMANDIILGNNGTTKFISDNTGAYIYNNLSVSGNVYDTDHQNKLKCQSKF